MQQKVALTTAHFPVRGRIADMGSGSGRGTFDLASLYHGLELVGVDINPVSIERAREKFQRTNLSYVVGDISQMVFPPDSLDGILDSSVLHHVTSFNNFEVARVLTTLDNQVAQLRMGGVIIIRDFVIPTGPEKVFLDLSETDGETNGTKRELSTAALFQVFAHEWRSSVNLDGPVAFSKTTSPRAGFVRFELTLRAAAEFVLRKDYRADWETEVFEEYTYLDQSQFEEAFRSRGLRIVTSRPLWNPWIVKHRFENKFYLSDVHDSPLPFPPTNYLIVGEKVRPGEGVELYEAESTKIIGPKFLSMTQHSHKESGKVFELVERPHQTIDVLPWFENDGQIFVLAKKDFPRPIVNACKDQVRLDRAALSGYITEPISAIVELENFEDDVRKIVRERAGLLEDDVVSIGRPHNYLTSPGGINELVSSCLVQIRPRESFEKEFPNYTAFKSGGSVRELDAQQVLRACHVGGMFDARLEVNIYRLLNELKKSPGPWIGAAVALSEQASDHHFDPNVFSPSPSAVFQSCEVQKPTQFLSIRDGRFCERSQDSAVISEVHFEYVVPQQLSFGTVVALPVIKTAKVTFVGLECRDLPAAQSFTGSSRIVTAPAWRLPRSVKNVGELPLYVAEAMLRDFALPVQQTWELGGPYFSSPGVTPEIVYPFAVEVDCTQIDASSLQFIEMRFLKTMLDLITDAHLLIVSNRLIHALTNLESASN